MTQMTRTKRIVEFFGLRRSMVALLSMVVLVGMGERMAERFLPVYLMAIGGGILTPGFLNALDNLLSALYSFPGGYLSDKLGYKRALLVFNLFAMAGFLIVIFIPTWQAVFIGSFFFISWTALSLPATMSLVSAVLPKNKRTMGVSMHSLVRRVPMALGPVIGGLLIGWLGRENGVRWAFVGAFILGLIALIMQQTMIEDTTVEKPKAEGNPLRLVKFMSSQLRVLLVADILIRFCEQIPYAYVVLWAMDLVEVSAFDFGILTTVEMVTAMLIYVPVAYLADRGTKKPFVVMTFVNFTLFPLFLLISHSFWLLALAFFVRGMKEFGEPTRKALIMDLAPEDKKAAMFGLYYLLRDVVVSVAPFVGAYLWRWSPEANLLTASACGAVGTVFFALFGRNAKPETTA